MNHKYTVVWAEVAEADLLGIVQYIATENLANARGALSKIKEKAGSLNFLPERGRVVPELSEQGVNLYRELIIIPWRLIYRIAEEKVYVMAVFDSRQNLEDLLLKRLIKL